MHAGDEDEVVQIQEGYFPGELVRGTPFAGPERIIKGTYAALEALGHAPTWITEEVTARMPTPEEATVLPPPDGVPVLVVVRITRDAERRVWEVLKVVAVVDRTVVNEDLHLG